MSEFFAYFSTVALLVAVVALRIYLGLRYPVYHNEEEGWFREDNHRDTKQYPQD